jgi:hypothetical protein
MKRIEISLVAALGTLALFVGSESYRTSLFSHRTRLESEGTVAPISPNSPTVHRPSAAATAELPLEVRRMHREDVKERLQQNQAGTYIGEVLADRDSALARWPDRVERPLRIWIGSGKDIAGWQAGFENEVRIAFNTWGTVGIPVSFELAPDSAHADVHVKWIDRFNEPISGKTVWSRDDDWWIVDAQITLAVHHSAGEALDPAAMHAIALHEVGHLIGLDHTRDAATIMTPRVHVRSLTGADRATVRLLYSLPPGAVR